MKNNTPTLTVAIPAYNEEKNIETLVSSLLRQKHMNFILQDITVHTDACSDSTVEIVKKLAKRNRLVHLHEGKLRMGKYTRLNTIFKSCRSEILVVLDGDIVIVGEHFLEDITTAMEHDSTVVLVAAHQRMFRPDGFISRVIYTNFLLWDYVRWSIPNYHSPSNYYGSATAYRGSFARSISIPKELTDPHYYLYLLADAIGGFRYCRAAEIRQWPIATMQDFNKFLHRSIGKKDDVLTKLFTADIEKNRSIHWKYKLIGVMKLILHEPLYAPFALVLIRYIKLAVARNTDSTSIWDVVKSTKKSINDEN